MDSIATEAVNIQIGNNLNRLAQDLDNFFTKVIQHRNEYVRNNQRLKRYKLVNGFKAIFNREYKDELRDIINKHTNIDCKQIKLSDTFAIQALGKDLPTLVMGMLAASGKLKPEYIMPQAISKLIQLDKAIDYKNAKITKLPISVYCQLYFDFNFSFFTKETCLDSSIFINEEVIPVPQELTAILLHEIGHMLTILEYASHLMYTGYYGNNLVYNYLRANEQQKKIIINDIKKNLGWLEKLYIRIKSDNLLGKSAAAISTHIESIIRIIKIIQQIKHISKVLTKIVGIVLPWIISLYTFIIACDYVSVYLLEEDIEALTTKKYGKSTEPASIRQSYLFETLADEFVSRFGYSRYLNSALEKIHRYKAAELSPYVADFMHTRARIFNFVMNLFLSIIFTLRFPFLLFSVISKSEYQSLMERLERNLYNMYSVIKQTKDLPADYQKTLLRDIEDMRKRLHSFSMENMRQVSTYGKLFQTILDYILLGKLQKALISGVFADAQMKTEVRKFLEVTDKLLSNSLYYHSAKLKDIARGL